MRSSDNYPFIYLGHGTGYYKNSMECYICFMNELNSEEKITVENIIPEILSYHFHWEYNVLFFSSNEELPFILYQGKDDIDYDELERIDDEILVQKIYDQEIWKKFHNELDEVIIEIDKKYTVKFFIKCVDYEHIFDLDQWHDWSVSRISDKILPYLYENYELLNNVMKLRDSESVLVPWYLNQILLFYIDQYEFEEIPASVYNIIIELINLYSGYDDYIDSYNASILGNILQNFELDNKIEKVKMLHPQVQFNLFSASVEDAKILMDFGDPILYLKDLIEISPEPLNTEILFNIGENISNVDFEITKDGIDLILTENEGSNLAMGIQILEMSLDFEGTTQDNYLYLIQIYNYLGMFDKSIKLIKRAIASGIDDPMFITGLLYALLRSEKKDDIDKYLGDFLKDEKIIANPYSLSNILYALNLKANSDASDIAIDLTKEYWRSSSKKMLSSLYINMTNTFIVAGKMDEIFDEIAEETKKIISENKNYFNPHEYLVYENLACYYAMKKDKKNTIVQLKMAKEFYHPTFEKLIDLEQFAEFRKDADFQNLFK